MPGITNQMLEALDAAGPEQRAEFFAKRTPEERAALADAIPKWKASRGAVTAEAGPSIGWDESLARGAGQGATLGFWDEIKGAADSLGISKRDLAMALLAGPGAPAVLAAKAASTATDKGADKTASDYRESRDTERAKTDAAKKANPKMFMAGEIGGGLASAAVPGAGAVSLTKAAVTGGLYGAAAGLGGSEADLTKGEVGDAAVDTAIGGTAGAVLAPIGYGAAKTIELGRGLANRLSKSKMVEGLTKYFDNITTRNGPPAAQKAAAGKMMEQAIKDAGDAVVVPENFLKAADEVLASGQSQFGNKMHPVAEEFAARAERVSTGKGVTLKDLHNEFKFWTDKADSLMPTPQGGDPSGHRIAVLAKKSIQKELEAAHPALGEAAELYATGRAAYRKGADASDLQNILLGAKNAASKGGEEISPRKFAVLNTGTKKAEVERHLASQGKEALEAWHMGVEASREIAKKGDRWIPKLIRDQLPEPVIKAFDNAWKSHNVMKAFTDPEMAREYSRLAFGARSLKTEEALGIVSRLTARLANEHGLVDEAAQKATDRLSPMFAGQQDPPPYLAGGKQ